MKIDSPTLSIGEIDYLLMRSASEESPLAELIGTFSCWEYQRSVVTEELMRFFEEGSIDDNDRRAYEILWEIEDRLVEWLKV